MRTTPFTTIAVDLDGTILHDDKTLSDLTRQTLLAAQQGGKRLIIASGRPTFGVTPIADTLRIGDFGGYVLSYNGGEIREWHSRRLIYENVLPRHAIPYIYKEAKAHGLTLLTYYEQFVVCEDAQNPYVQRSAFANRMEVMQVENFLEAVSYDIVKCMIVGPPEQLEPLEQEMALRLSGIVNVFRSEPFYLEFVPNHIDKGRCLALLLHEIGEQPEHLIAFGDGFNDISMLEFAGLGVAMSNARDLVRRAADRVTRTNEQDGVARFLLDYIL